MEAKLIKTKVGYHLWLNPEIKEQKHIASDYEIVSDNGAYLRKYKLSLKNCQAIEDGYDLDELAKEFVDYEDSLYHSTIKNTYMHGFQKALEILGDKKFSEDDVNLAFVLGKNKDESRINKLINSKLQQTEWDVIIKTTCDGMVTGLCCSEVCDCNIIPKLDADNCLILKRK